jgi:hypothetical protein
MASVHGRKLQVPEKTVFTWRFETAQRICWALMALIVVAALSGLTGAGGPLSHLALGLAEVPTVMRVGRTDYITVYSADGSDTGLGPTAGTWLGIGSGTQAGPDRLVLPVTPRQTGLARLTVPTSTGQTVETTVLILP